MGDKVVLVTVTYNSSHYLDTLLKACSKSTFSIDHIVIVDNNSQLDHKKQVAALADGRTDITVIYLQQNTGGAGGFEAGMDYVRRNLDFDWIWLMDDDAYPAPSCLETLLLHSKEESKNIGGLVPLIFGIDNKKYQLYHYKVQSYFLIRDMPAINNLDSISEEFEIEASAFVGPLISKRVVDNVGIADGTYFIYGDDLDYTYRISRKFKVMLIKDAIIYHKDFIGDSGQVNPKNWWKDYYQYRNRLFFINSYAATNIRKIIGISLYSLILMKRVGQTIIVKKTMKHSKLRRDLIFKALSDGLTNKRGKTLDPKDYILQLEKENLKLEKRNIK